MKTLLFPATLIIALGAVPASAQPLQQQLSRCLAIPGVLQRLNCYDSVAKGAGIPPQASAAPMPAPAPVYRAPVTASAAPVYVPPPPAQPSIGLGSERLPTTAAAAPRRENAITAGITSIVYDGTGRFTMTLDNGQVWRQLNGDQNYLHGTRFHTAHVTRGALNSYDVTVDALHASYRVTRIQ